MKFIWNIFMLLLLGLLAACGSASGIQEETEYESFRDTINSDDFTGFAYLIWRYDQYDEETQETLDSVFDNNGENVIAYILTEDQEDTRNEINEDSSDPNIYHPFDKIAFIDEGTLIDEFEIDRDELHTSEHNNELAAFIEQYQ